MRISDWSSDVCSSDLSGLWLRLASPGRVSEINGGLRLADGSWLYFGMRHSGGKWTFAIGRMGLALIPVLALLIVGGIGAIEVNARYDHLDLSDGAIVGGRQQAALIGLVWAPIDYIRITANYGKLWID